MRWRFRFILIVFLFGFLLTSLRLFYWQIVKSADLAKIGESQYGRIIKNLSERGEIRASDGFPIAGNTITYRVISNPKETRDKEKVINALSPILEIDEASLSAKLSLNLFWVSLKTGVNDSTKKKIESLNISGVDFEKEYTRFYPESSLAASLLGFVGKDEKGADIGYFGLEGYYDKLLRGKEQSAVQIYDAIGRPILAEINKREEDEGGSSLTLHMNRSIQFIAERELKNGIERYGAEGGMVGIMDPKTGGLLAMASFPSFDPEKYYEYPPENFKNSFISSLYEPGSTFKPLVMSGALNEKKVTPATRCAICAGPIKIGGYSLKTWNDKYYPRSTMTEVIQHSDNTGMVFVGQRLGLDNFLKYLKKFGIGSLTGIDLQGEVAGDLKTKAQWYPVDLATASFGQGISITPIELLTAFSAIANNGVMMEPHVVAQVKSTNGKVVNITPKILGKPITSSTAKIMTEMLVNAVDKGEAKWTAIKEYRIAGKTGTASIPVAGHYDPEKTIASFIGFAPADDPKFVILVIFDRPKARIYGSETAAPVFFSIARDLLSLYKIPPTR